MPHFLFNPKIFFVFSGLFILPVFAKDPEPINYIDLKTLDHHSWLDKHKGSLTDWIDNTAYKLDDFFGKPNPDKPADASLRVMMDTYYDKHDNLVIKPRLRGKIRLPTLEHHLHAVIGDDDLDNEQGGGSHTNNRPAKSDNLFDRQSHKDNTSLALRASRLKQDLNIKADLDIGVRGSDIYLKLYGQKQWHLAHQVDSKIEQTYKYGTKSEHYALSTLEFSQPQSKTRTLFSRSHVIYTHKNHVEDLSWSHSFYQEHHWKAKHGSKQFYYGVYFDGDINDNNKANLNSYGPYVSYRQPIWRDWLFIQTQISFYNNKDLDRNHYLATFGRLEILF